MKKASALLLAFIFIFTLAPAIESEAAIDLSTIKVKLTTNNATSIAMSVSGSYFINENGAVFTGGTLTLRASGGRISVSHSSAGEIYSGGKFSIMRVRMDPSAGYIRFNSRSYLGHFNIKLTGSGYIQVVNEVPLAHYLYGVVGNEMSNTYPIEALKAQAIAAKCYVFSQILLSANSEYYLGDTSSDQVYKGYSSWASNVISAVDQTLNEILTVNGNILCTYYAASNGGETNLVTYAWPNKNATNAGYAITTDDYDMISTVAKIEKVDIPITSSGTITKALYNLIVAKAYTTLGVQIDAIERISAVSMYNPKYQGVVRNMSNFTIRGDFGVTDASGAYNIYRNIDLVFSTSELLSYGVVTDSSLRVYWGEYSADGSYFRIYHARWGHGVGMSQCGAHARASAGYSYRDILAFYYPGASFTTMAVTQPVDPVIPSGVTSPITQPMPTQDAGGAVAAYGELTGDLVNFREGPSTSYKSITRLRKGSSLLLYSSSNGWYRASANGVTGYISGSYVKITGYPDPVTAAPTTEPVQTPVAWQTLTPITDVTVTPTPALTTAPVPTTAGVVVDAPTAYAYGEITIEGVNFRTGPAVSYVSQKKLSKGASVLLYSLVANGEWYYAGVDGAIGYVSSLYVKVLGLATPPPSASPTPAPTTAWEQTKVETGKITRSGVNMRQGPGVSYALLKQLSENTAVYVIVRYGEWCYVLVGDQQGYVHSDYIKVTGTAALNADGTIGASSGTAGSGGAVTTPTTGEGVTTGNVNMRIAAGVTYAQLAVLQKGTKLTLLALENGWYKAKTANGKEGYVSSKYVQVTTQLPESAVINTEKPKTDAVQVGEAAKLGVGETTGNVNFREQASAASKKIATLSKGAALTLYSLNNGWYEAEYKGMHGYISAKYVKATVNAPVQVGAGSSPGSGGGDGVTANTGAVTLATAKARGRLNIRSLPSTSGSKVVSVMPSGAVFNVLGVTGDWYYVVYNEAIGFAYKSYADLVSSGSAGVPQIASSVSAYQTTTRAELNMRTGPGTQNAKIKLLPNKSTITVLLVTDGWCLIKADGALGYVSADYVNLK